MNVAPGPCPVIRAPRTQPAPSIPTWKSISYGRNPYTGTTCWSPAPKPTPEPKACCAWKAKTISCRMETSCTYATAADSVILPRLPMSPITTSILLGLTAAGANALGGAIIVQKSWNRRYLQYFIALGSGFMLGTALLEMVPESIRLAGASAPLLVLGGYLIVHFFEHTVTSHFHFGEETHAEEFVRSHRGYSFLFGLIIHTFFDGIAITSGFLISNWLG